jgi:hypothetical protein
MERNLDIILDALKFSVWSAANPAKSTFYCAGVSHRVKEQLLKCLNMKEWKLLVKYLGVTLISKRLSAADLAILLEKISDRILGYR